MPADDQPSLDLRAVVPATYCLHTDCAAEIMDLRAAVREAVSDRWRAVATAKLLRGKLKELRRTVVATDQLGGGVHANGVRQQRGGSVIRRALQTNPLFDGFDSMQQARDFADADFRSVRASANSDRTERGELTARSVYTTGFVEHYEYHQSLQELTNALNPLLSGLCVLAALAAALQAFTQWRRHFRPYTFHGMRADGDVISEHPSRTRGQCRKRCDRDRSCVAFAMPVAGPDHRPGQAAQKCATYRRFSHDPVPFDHRMDVDPGAGWATWTKHDMTFRGCPPHGCGD